MPHTYNTIIPHFQNFSARDSAFGLAHHKIECKFNAIEAATVGGFDVKTLMKSLVTSAVLAVLIVAAFMFTPSRPSNLPSELRSSFQGVEAQNLLNVQLVGLIYTSDVCQNPTIAKSHAAVNIASPTTTQLVALSTGKTVYVCNFTASLAGTTPTIQFETGTGSACVTSPTVLTGAFAPTSGSMLKLEGAGVQFQGAASKELCAVTVGTGASAQGYIDYVQQ